MSKQGKRNWFDIATTLWAIALVVVALTWVASPAFAGRGGGTDCMGLCANEGFCSEEGGCKTGAHEGGQCGGECREGGDWSCQIGV